MSAIEIWVDGTPAPQGSKRHVGRGIMVESSKKVKPWRAAVAAAAREAMQGREMLRDCPIRFSVAFFFVRPASHRSKRGGLKPSARKRPHVQPDLSKLLRATEDALTGIVWDDDARVVEGRISKLYDDLGHGPGARMMIEEVRL